MKYNYDYVKKFISDNSDSTLLSQEYKTSKSKLLIICKCGETFEATFEKFKSRNKRCCNQCSYSNRETKYTIEYVQEYASKYECQILSSKYVNTKSKMGFKCKCGNIFETSFEKFKSRNKTQCNECTNQKHRVRSSKKYDEVKCEIEESNCKLLSKNYYNGDIPLLIQCQCGNIFYRTYYNFRKNNNKRCHECTSSISAGEQRIVDFFNYHNINFISEKTFSDLKSPITNYNLRFDFYVNQNNKEYIIEYDGAQHFQPVEYFGGVEKFNQQKLYDSIKTKYCNDNAIELIRIPYYEYDNINNILKEILL